MSKAKQQAYQNAQQSPQYQPMPYSSSSSSFAWGFILGQLLLALILFVFIKFFIFGEAPGADERAANRAAARRQRTVSHTRQRTLSTALHPRPSTAVLKTRLDTGLTVQKILEKTYYNVNGHQPESLDWFNVLIAQTIAQLRADAQEDQAILTSLNAVLNGSHRPDFLDEIRVTEISLGEEFPIFSNCRVIPVDENGVPLKELTGQRGERLQARMDIDLSDVMTLGIETKLVLNYPKPFVAALPIALSVSVVRFSGTLSLSFLPSSKNAPASSTNPDKQQPSPSNPPSPGGQTETNEGHPLNPTGQSPTTLTFTFLDDYRLDLSVHSLIGSRARLQDVPKIAQLIEARIHQWFDDRCVEPRFQQIVLPSLWPRMKNARGGGDDDPALDDSVTNTTALPKTRAAAGPETSPSTTAARDPAVPSAAGNNPRAADPPGVITPPATAPAPSQAAPLPGSSNSATTAEQRTRDWAAQLHASSAPKSKPAPPPPMSELELAGQEMREADERARRKLQHQVRQRTG